MLASKENPGKSSGKLSASGLFYSFSRAQINPSTHREGSLLAEQPEFAWLLPGEYSQQTNKHTCTGLVLFANTLSKILLDLSSAPFFLKTAFISMRGKYRFICKLWRATNVFLGGAVGPLIPVQGEWNVIAHCRRHLCTQMCSLARESGHGELSQWRGCCLRQEGTAGAFLGGAFGGGCLNSNYPPRGMGTLGLQAVGHTCSKYSVLVPSQAGHASSTPLGMLSSTNSGTFSPARFGPCLLSPDSLSRVF